MMKNYVNEITEIMFNYDIADIIFCEFQADEYSSEAKLVLQHINADMTVEEVADICRQVYDHMFFPNKYSVEQFIEMASEILKILN